MYYNLISSMNHYDLDSLKFFFITGITNNNQKKAINNLVLELKNYNIWDKMKAIYPFIGGTAYRHKFNLKDPRDNELAFRLNFAGGWTHSSTGVLPNGTNSYADTFLIPSINLNTGGDHLSYYSRSNNSTDIDYLISAQTTSPITALGIVGKRNSTLGTNGRGFFFTSNPTSIYSTARQDNSLRDTRGLFVGISNGANTYYILNNNILATNTTINIYSNRLTNKLIIGAFIVDNTIAANGYSNKECAFASIGNELTTTQATDLYNIVQNYQTTLGRQV